MDKVRFLSDIPWWMAIFWYYLAFLAIMLLYAYRKVPADEFIFRKWVILNRLRLGLAGLISVVLCGIMFAPDAVAFLTAYLPLKTTFATPLIIGGATAGLLIATFDSKEV